MIDPQQRWLAEVTWEAMEDAGIPPEQLAGSRTGVFVGITNNDYGRLLLTQVSEIDAHSASGSSGSVAAGRLSYALGLRGPSMSIDTACSSSLVAVHLACHSLRSDECELALAGGDDGVDATRIIADHSAQVAIFVGRRIGTVRQVVLIGVLTKMVEHYARLYPGIFLLGIQLDDLVQVLREINNHGHVAALPGQTGSPAASQDGSLMLAGHSHGLNHVVNGSRNNHANGNLPVIGAVGGIESAAAFIKANFSRDAPAQIGGQGISAITGKGLISS